MFHCLEGGFQLNRNVTLSAEKAKVLLYVNDVHVANWTLGKLTSLVAARGTFFEKLDEEELEVLSNACRSLWNKKNGKDDPVIELKSA